MPAVEEEEAFGFIDQGKYYQADAEEQEQRPVEPFILTNERKQLSFHCSNIRKSHQKAVQKELRSC